MEDIELLLIYFLHDENAAFDIKAGAEINILRFVLAHAADISEYVKTTRTCSAAIAARV